MAYFLTRRSGLNPRYTGQPRIPRREFGNILFAVTGYSQAGSDLRVDREVQCSSNYTMPWNPTGLAPTQATTAFGPAVAIAGTGGTYHYGWGNVAGTEGWVPAGGLSKLSIVFAGRATGNLANNALAIYGGSASGYSLDSPEISASTLTILRARPSQNGAVFTYAFSIGSGQLVSSPFTWRAGSSGDGFLNGVAAGTLTNGPTSIGAIPTGQAGFGVAATYTVGADVNLILIGDRPIPISLAQDISANPWESFEPVRKAFYVSGATDSTAPTWGGGAAITSSNVTHNAFDLAWPEATDDTAVTQYRYRIDGDSWNNTGTTRTASLSGFAAGTGYDIEVCAGDAADNWSTALTLTVTTQSLKINPSIYDPVAGTARASQTGLGILVLGEKPGATDTPTVLAHSATETTDGSGVLDVPLNTAGVDPGDVVWVVMVKSDGVPANAGYSFCWPVTVVAV